MSDVKIDYHIDEVKTEMTKNLQLALEQVGLIAEGDAKLKISKQVYDQPLGKSGYIRTGRLRNSITHTIGKEMGTWYAYIGTNVEYAPYVHEGTMYMRPRRFLRDAIDENLKEYRQVIEFYLKNG